MTDKIDNYHIEMRSSRIIGWGWLIFCTAGLIITLLAGLYWPAAASAFSALFGVYMVLGAGSFDIDSDGLIHTSSFGTWQIRWEEITRVEIGEVEGTIVLHGSNKRFILSSPGGWEASIKDSALAFIFQQIATHEIPTYQSKNAAYKIMKNTRIKPDKQADKDC